MADVTLLTMLTQALREADAEGHLDMAVAGDKSRVVDYINAGCERLHDILTEAFEDYQLVASSAITIAAGQSSVSAGMNNLLKARFLEWWPSGAVDSGDPIDVEPLNLAERNRYAGPRAYFLGGAASGSATLYVRPTAEAPGVYRMWYTPTLVQLAVDADAFSSVNGWHRWAVLDAAIKLKGDMDRDASVLLQRQSDLERHIKSIASRRISGRPAKVRRVRKTLLEWTRDQYDPNRWTP